VPFVKGDVDCSDGDTPVSSVDALKLLRHVAGLSVNQTEPCDDVGTGSPMQGDINCSDDISSVDALFILRWRPERQPTGRMRDYRILAAAPPVA
jgi:hypothetical protein